MTTDKQAVERGLAVLDDATAHDYPDDAPIWALDGDERFTVGDLRAILASLTQPKADEDDVAPLTAEERERVFRAARNIAGADEDVVQWIAKLLWNRLARDHDFSEFEEAARAVLAAMSKGSGP